MGHLQWVIVSAHVRALALTALITCLATLPGRHRFVRPADGRVLGGEGARYVGEQTPWHTTQGRPLTEGVQRFPLPHREAPLPSPLADFFWGASLRPMTNRGETRLDSGQV